MANIGYAVFGRPKGLETVCNGLFSELGIESTLYLSDADVILEPGELVLMVKRIPTNLSILDKKDGILIAVYEQAYQHLEKRTGGFVGSAICFKEYNPNSEKLIKGLFALFSQIRKQVNDSGRFKKSDASEWAINLPTADNDYGFLTNTKLRFQPLNGPIKKISVSVPDLKSYSFGILDNACLNWKFHAVHNIYLAQQDPVLSKLVSKGAPTQDYAQFFIYKEQIQYVESEIKKKLNEVSEANSKLHKLNDEFENKENKILNLNNSIQILESKSETVQNNLEKKKGEIESIKHEHENWKEKENEHKGNIKELVSKKNSLKSIVLELEREKGLSETGDKNKYTKAAKGNSHKKGEEKEKKKEVGLTFGKGKRNYKLSFFIAISVAVLMTLLVIYYIFFKENCCPNNTYEEGPQTEVNATNIDDETNLINYINLWDIESASDITDVYNKNVKMLQEKEGLTNGQMKDLKEYPSKYYEEYKDSENIINFLNNRYLIPDENDTIGVGTVKITNEVRRSDDMIEILFGKYEEAFSERSIYNLIPQEFTLKDSIIRNKHFKWMLDANNAEDWQTNKDLEEIKVPIIKKGL
ncbi:MAG: hypothetical protein GQ574_27480 [Crocinitomix sp.]|nr:hypothetical protein [Crocinitomix sp.]